MSAIVLLAALAGPSSTGLARFVWLLILLIAIAIGLVIGVVLLMRILRRRHQPGAPRRAGSTLDPWLESGRRLDSEARDG